MVKPEYANNIQGYYRRSYYECGKSCPEIFNAIFFPEIMKLQIGSNWNVLIAGRRVIPPLQGFLRSVQTSCRISVPGNSSQQGENVASGFLRQKKIIPDAEPPSLRDVELLYQFFDNRWSSLYPYLSYVHFSIIINIAFKLPSRMNDTDCVSMSFIRFMEFVGLVY